MPGPILPVEDPDEVWAVFWAGGSEIEEHGEGEGQGPGPACACALSVGPARAGQSRGTVSLGIFGAIIKVPLGWLTATLLKVPLWAWPIMGIAAVAAVAVGVRKAWGWARRRRTGVAIG